ncbi:MAG: hypothetical protein P4L50_06455 [Anaerolineaceae bacterium]|nr:hypothetical protein [Anaerolineaceae bacterium]
MSEDATILAFNSEIDRMLGQEPVVSSPAQAIPTGSQDLLMLATRLAEIDFGSELRPQPELRARWLWRSKQVTARQAVLTPVQRSRWFWAAFASLILFAMLFIFRQPVLAAVGRLFGYGYFPQAGFVELDTAQVLRSHVRQEHAGRSLTVLNGLARPKQTVLWLEYSDTARAADGAWLETPSGERVDLSSWEWDPNQPDRRGVRLEFPPLPAGAGQTTLALPEGWRIPLEWIPAAQAGIPLSEVGAPYPTTAPAFGQKLTPEKTVVPCIVSIGLQVCLKAAQTDTDGTHILLAATSQDGHLTPGGDFFRLVTGDPLTNDVHITLTDDLGNVSTFPDNQPPDPARSDGGAFLQPLTFPPVSPQAKQLILRVPALAASTAFSESLQLAVDLGANPQPGQNLAVDQQLNILGQTVRFRQATLEGDGSSSLRLTLYSDPVESKNGLLIDGLDLGKPAGIDDGYGSGSIGPEGRIKVYTELIGSVSGKKTGRLIFPIIGAQVLLLGPFDFSFPAPPPVLPQPTETPVVVGGESFTPQPTPTSLSLDSYRYDGRSIQPGDLLYTMVGDTSTDLYAASPKTGFTPGRVATLPGQIYQVYLQPDRLGIDYLAGLRVIENSDTFYRSVQIYTLRFSDPHPILLATFPRGPANNAGTEMTANWSYDGRLMVFQLFNFETKPGDPLFKIGLFDLNCRATGNCQPQYLQAPAGIYLYQPQFSPNKYQILLSGTDEDHGSHMQDVYLFDFDSNGRPGSLVNLTNSDQTDEWPPQWLPDGSGFLTACSDSSLPINEYYLCQYSSTNPGPKNIRVHMPFNMHQFYLSPDGKLLVDLTSVPAAQQEAYRLFDLNTRQTSILKQNESLDWETPAFSADSQYLGFIWENGQRATVIQLAARKEYSILDTKKPGSLSWLGWAR